MKAMSNNNAKYFRLEYGGIGPNFKENTDINVLAEQVPILLAKVRSLNK